MGVGDGKALGVDGVNRSTWSRVALEYETTEGWSDPGELGALTFVADRVRDAPVLDIGVGAGRTLSLLRLLSADYAAVDYTPELVELCRARHPGADVRLGDARELRDFADHSKGFVVFSSNGIDAVDHEDRQLILASVHRVLRPGGILLFSTLNKDGPLYGAHPGVAPDITWLPGSLRPAAPHADAVTALSDDDPAWMRAIRNWKRLRVLSIDEPDWGIAPFAAHEYGLVTHFSTVTGAIAELDRHGFETMAAFPCDRVNALEPDEATTAFYLHLVAERR